MTSITIRCPDDFHHHCRDGPATASVLKHAYPRFRRCLMMPNLKPPVTTTELALEYKNRILDALKQNGQDPSNFQPLMTLYLTDRTTPDEIKKASALKNDDGTPTVIGCKYYPAGATTNSDFGVTDVKNLYPVLEAMQEVGMMLCIHSEVTHADIFEREPIFIEEIMKPLVQDFPRLKITMEHISTQEAVEYVLSAPSNVKASITCHHLIYNRNHMLVGGIRPHLYCLPILKAEVHRKALVEAATSGNPKFFLGTDSAPHATHTKEAACGCAGVFSAHCCIEIYAQVFEQAGKLDRLEDFCSSFGADHYGIARNTSTITLEKKPWKVPMTYEFGADTVTPLKAGEEVEWQIVGSSA
eukprot:CAMPEP_0178743628 /NCGR_PEP_ID=MMETSP0744-20121128/6308_1 /TAXON_ID=913974 /ORGANISM="Nitzschia punctata, Strain CCMP561" /LENGTH=355 /DNA_ID=CAMNT_0020396647 /DNA_START=227 /DNA_END=1294 /DNA_ORIENTATION=+